MKIHICALDRDCRQYGIVHRVGISFSHFHWTFAYLPGSKIWRDGKARWTHLIRRKRP